MSPLIPLSKALIGIGVPALGAAGYTAYENLMAAKDRFQERQRTPEDKTAADLEGAVNRYRERLIDQILGITRDTSDSVRLALMGQDTNSLEATLTKLRSEAMQGSPVRDLTPEQRQQLQKRQSEAATATRRLQPSFRARTRILTHAQRRTDVS